MNNATTAESNVVNKINLYKGNYMDMKHSTCTKIHRTNKLLWINALMTQVVLGFLKVSTDSKVEFLQECFCSVCSEILGGNHLS